MTADKNLWRNRKERKECTRRLQSEDPGLEVVVHPHAAGIDVGNSAHYVAVRPELGPAPVRRLLKLHTYGLLNNSFQPPAEIRALRTYCRQRGEHVAGAATCIQRIQKALTRRLNFRNNK
jgi:hypothetical protein